MDGFGLFSSTYFEFLRWIAPAPERTFPVSETRFRHGSICNGRGSKVTHLHPPGKRYSLVRLLELLGSRRDWRLFVGERLRSVTGTECSRLVWVRISFDWQYDKWCTLLGSKWPLQEVRCVNREYFENAWSTSPTWLISLPCEMYTASWETKYLR